MLSNLVLLAAAATAATAADVPGYARVVNNCSFPVTLWSVGSVVSDAHTLAANGGQYMERYYQDPKTGGRTLKLTREPDGLFTGKPQADFAYNLRDDQVWYDLSDVFGDPFAGHQLRVASNAIGSGGTTPNGDCPFILWGNGIPPGPNQTKVCRATSTMTLTLCHA